MKTLRGGLTLLVSLGLLGGAALLSFILIKTSPKTAPEDKGAASTVVQVMNIQPAAEHISVTAYGPVVAAREVSIKPQVGGRVVDLHPDLSQGGHLMEGDQLIVIDPSDYEIALNQRKAEFEEAQFEFEVEQGRQLVAEREWEQLRKDLPGAEVNNQLVLRKPHRKLTEAMLDKAQSAIEQAELDLARTQITAPFNGMVVKESVEVGQVVDRGDEVCTLVGSDEFWVRATVPMGDLKWITLPKDGKPGSKVVVTADSGTLSASWDGEVTRLLSDLDPNGRMARILIRVPDPLGMKQEDPEFVPLLLGSYVQVEIEAGVLDDVLAIPRNALRRDDRIWVVDKNHELQIREAEVLWTQQETVLVSNALEAGETLVVSDLRSALPGMKVEPQVTGEKEKTLAEQTTP